MLKTILNFVGLNKLVLIAAVIMALVIAGGVGVAVHKYKALENKLEKAELRADYNLSQYEACTLRESAAKEAIAEQRRRAEAEQARMTEALSTANAEISRINNDYAGRKSEVITKLVKDDSCEARLKLIQESQAEYWRGR